MVEDFVIRHDKYWILMSWHWLMNWLITVTVFRKPTHTDRYLDFNSHHHIKHKCSVAKTLLDRVQCIPSTPSERSSETKHVFRSLSANGYPKIPRSTRVCGTISTTTTTTTSFISATTTTSRIRSTTIRQKCVRENNQNSESVRCESGAQTGPHHLVLSKKTQGQSREGSNHGRHIPDRTHQNRSLY